MVSYSERVQGSPVLDFISDYAQTLSIALFFIVCMIFFGAMNPVFLSAPNMLNIFRQAAPILIVAVSMTFVITTSGIDLSVGSFVALINALAAILMTNDIGWVATAILMLVAGAIIGAAQGWFVAYQRIPAFIVTLATLSILRGVALLMTGGYSIPVPASSGFFWLGRGNLFGIPVPAVIAIFAAILGFVVLRHTRYGRRVIATGSNLEAARRVGIPSKKILMSVYMLSGITCTVAGLLVAARLGSGSSNAAEGFELQVIAAVVLGGTPLSGGRASIVGTVLGTQTIAIIGNGLILMHVSPFFTQIVTGSIILLAIWINSHLLSPDLKIKKSA